MNGLLCSEKIMTIRWAVFIQYRVMDGRRTDRQTDVQPISITCFSIADARKNCNAPTCLLSIGGSVKEQPGWNSMTVERGCSNILPPHIYAYIASRSSKAFTLCDPVTLSFDLWPLNSFTSYRVMGFHSANFGLRKPFRSRVRSRHATDRQTDGRTAGRHFIHLFTKLYHDGRCLSVRLSASPSVACIELTRAQKGLGSPKLAGWKPITR